MGFKFANYEVKIEIEDVEYTVDIGNEKMLAKVSEYAQKLTAIDFEALSDHANAQLTNNTRQTMISMFGKEQFEQIEQSFGRQLDLINAVELFAYAWGEITKSNKIDMMSTRISQYLPDDIASE